MFSLNAYEHISHNRTVLSLLYKAGFRLSLKKCNFYTEMIDFLEHVIRPGKLELPDHPTEGIGDLKPLCNVIKLKSFHGVCNKYRRFAQNFAGIAVPLN